jgi:hypothetical protein
MRSSTVARSSNFAGAGASSIENFLLDPCRICRDIAHQQPDPYAGGFSERLSLGNQLTPVHIIKITAASIPIGPPNDSDSLITF